MITPITPIYDEQTRKWSYDGRPVYSFKTDFFYDFLTEKILDINGVLYEPYTFKLLPAEYTGEDLKLIPVKYMNPLDTPTEATKDAILDIIEDAFAENKELELEVTQLTAYDLNESAVLFLSLKNGNSEKLSIGRLAWDEMQNGRIAMITKLKEILKDAGVLT